MNVIDTFRVTLPTLFFSFIASNSLALPEPPPSPPPPPRPTPDLPLEACLLADETDHLDLISIRPIASEQNLTGQENPTLLFYNPYIAEEGKFIVIHDESSDVIYEASFRLPSGSGIVSLTINADLEPNQYYRWHFRVSCLTQDNSEEEITIGGLVYYHNLGDAFLYYDELSMAAMQQRTSNNNLIWANLLAEIDALDDENPDGDIDLINLVDYSQVSILGPVLIINEVENSR